MTTKILFEPALSDFDINGNLIDQNDERYVDLNDVNFFISVPYTPNAQSIEIRDENNSLKLTVNVSNLSPIKYSLVEETLKKGNENYGLAFSITTQPIGIWNGTNYKLQLGPLYYSGE